MQFKKKIEKKFDEFLKKFTEIVFNVNLETGKQIREPSPLVKKFDRFWCKLWGIPEEPVDR